MSLQTRPGKLDYQTRMETMAKTKARGIVSIILNRMGYSNEDIQNDLRTYRDLGTPYTSRAGTRIAQG